MNEIPPYVWPIVSVICSALGGWVGVKVSVTKLEVEMAYALKNIQRIDRKLALHSDDLLTHDMELEQALNALQLKRARRQPLRGWEE